MAQFKRSVQPTGFRPEEVSEKNVTRLQEYSDRIASALREERDAVISNRNRTADAMKENAQIEANQSAANQKIQDQNLETQLKQQQVLAEQALNEYDRKTEQSNKFFSTVSSLSTTAAQKLKEQEVARNQKKYDSDLAEIMLLGENSPLYKSINALAIDTNVEMLKANTQLAQAQERGLDPLIANQYAKNFEELSPGYKEGYLKIVANKYHSFLTDQASADTTGASRNKDKAGVFSANKLDEFMKLQGVKGINPALLKKSGFLEATLNVNQRFMDAAGKAQLEDDDVKFQGKFNATVRSLDAAAATQFIQVQWPDLQRRYGLSGALDYLEGLAKQTDSDGKPLNKTASIMAAKVGPNGETFGNYWPKRREAVEIALAQAANAAGREAAATREREADEYVRNVILPSVRKLHANAPASEDLSVSATAEKQILEKTGGFLPKSWIEYKKNIENQNKEEAANLSQRALALLGTGEAANINKARELIYRVADPELRQELITKYNSVTNPIQLSEDNKKELDKSITAVSREIVDNTLEGSSSNTALRLAGYIRTDAYRMYKEEFKKTKDETLALANVRARLDAAKVSAKKGEGRYRKAFGKFNETIFPGLEAEDKTTQAAKDARIQSMVKKVRAQGISVLSSPGFLTEKELRTASEASEQNIPLNKIATPEILALKQALSTKGKNVTFGEIFNRQISAFNARNPNNPIKPLGISPLLQIIDSSHPATLKAIANNSTAANVARGIAESSPGGKELRNNIRPFFSGNTGLSTAPHGDFRVKDLATGRFIDPTPFLNRLTVNGKPLSQQFTMTSPFGMRTHPIHGDRRMHNGVDYGMPVGTKVDVNADFLERVFDPSGGGNMNIYTFTQNGRRYEIWALHGK
jgi:hypothetical protein